MLMRIALLLAFTAALNASARETPESWLELRSPNFIVVSNGSDKQARHIADQLERMRSVFQTLYPESNADFGSPIVALALKDRKSFQTLEPEAYLAKGQLDLAGLFLAAPDKNYILLRLDAEGEHPYATIYHEYTHFRVRKNSDWLPLWVNEGLAEFFQNTEIEDKEVYLGEPSPDDIQYLRQNRLLPLTTLFKVDQNSPYYHDEQKGSVFYAESWALVHYLQVKDFPTHAHRLADYLQLVSQNIDSVTAAERAFGDLTRLQEALDLYVRQANFQQFKAAVPTNVDETAFKVHALTLPQANAVRADFLAYDKRTKDAYALLDSILHDDPENVQAHETMGYLSFSDGNIPAARDWYAQAVKLGSKNYLTQYYFASMSMSGVSLSAEGAAAVETSLDAAIELNPSFAPSYDTLATLYANRHEKLDEAHILNLKALELDPGNLSYRLNAANILLEMDKGTDAIRVLQQTLKVAKTPQEHALVDSRLQFIQTYQQAQSQQATAQKTQEAQSNGGGEPSSTQARIVILEKVDPNAPKHPDETPYGATRVVTGTVRNAACSYPSILDLKIVGGTGKTLSFYSNDYFKINFSASNFTPKGDLHPCTDLNGLKARVEYSETSDKAEDGQIVSMVLSK
jgi:tetratricopeptide (TPR) repeat protein